MKISGTDFKPKKGSVLRLLGVRKETVPLRQPVLKSIAILGLRIKIPDE